MRPSRLIRAVLARLLDPVAPDHLGDLDEEFNERVRPNRRWLRAELWYGVQAVSLVWGVLVESFSGGVSAGGSGARPGLQGTQADLRATLRRLRREPTPSILMVLTLSLGMGGAMAIFAVADAAFLRPLPYPGQDRLVSLHTGFDFGANSVDALSPLNVRGIQAQTGVVEEVGVWTLGESVHRTDGETAIRLEAPRANSGLFRILGAEPVVGRLLGPDDDDGAGDAVVLSHGLWTRQFGGDPGVVGSTIDLDGEAHRIVGVAPPAGMLPRDADVWRSLVLGPEWYEDDRWGWQFLATLGRLVPGRTLGDASAALNRALAEETDRVDDGLTRVVIPLREELVGDGASAVLVLSLAGLLLLATACLNVVSILLARLESRAADFSVRRALGSGTLSLGRLVGMEALIFATAGSLGGLALAWGALEAVSTMDMAGLASVGPLEVGPRVIGFALALTVGVSGLFGAASLFGALRVAGARVLGSGLTNRTTGGARAGRVRAFLASGQIGLSAVLLAVVAVSASTFSSILTNDPGFRADGVLTATIELPRGISQDEASARYLELVERAEALPGVESASAVFVPPLRGVQWSASFEILEPSPMGEEDPGGIMRPAMPGYFETMGIPVLEGRAFATTDDASGAPVVVIDETVARRHWPDRSPIGERVQVGALSRDPATIIGVVGDVAHERPDRTDGGHVYLTLLQDRQRELSLVVRSDGDPLILAPLVETAIRSVDPGIAIAGVATMESVLREAMAGPRIALTLLALFGALTATLAAIGVYGVLSYSVVRRTREIGTRMAMGASPRKVLGVIMTQSLGYWLLGMALAVPVVALALPAARRWVPELVGASPWSYLAVPLGLVVVTLIAAALPARRAVRLQPTEALRQE